jgi:VanZ family protein
LTHSQSTNSSSRRWTWAIAAGCYLLFVVYGSLVPLDWRPRPLEEAWQAYLTTPYLALDVGMRADWVANILLYIPLAYLLSAALLAGVRSAVVRVIGLAVVFAACAAVALGVEFAQLFFPPRTVSMNDIIAEFIGSGLGIAIWLKWGNALERLWRQMERGGLPAIRAAVVVYVLAYLALSLFPYDFLVSAQEVSEKLRGGGYGLFVASGACARLSICAGKLVAELVAVVPLGVLLSMALGKTAQRAYAIAVLCGLALGLTIEALQLIIASGVSQGVSLVTRAAGMLIGVALHRHVRLRWLSGLQPYAVSLVLIASPVYLFVLMWANGWFTEWAGVAHARASFEGVFWLPFYYHYYTTETHAMRSALACVAMYLPVGFGYWIWTLRRGYAYSDGFALVPALIAAPLALVMEMGKLFMPEKHPDPTNVLIAVFAAPAAYLVAGQLQKWALQGEAARPSSAARPGPAESQSAARVLPALLLLGGTSIAVLNYPLGGAWLVLALGLYAAMLWRHPGVCLPAVLALLPLLDFAPWSGWVLLNEFDLLIAVTLVVRLLRPPPEIAGPTLSSGAKLVIGLLAVSFFASAMVGLLPLSPFDQNALVSYYGSFSSLRQLKGFAWALMLLPLLIEETQQPQRMFQRLVTGMLAGLGGVVAVSIYQRAVFAGLMDFAGEYRVEGSFPELHTGGGDIHAYLIMAIPFVVAWISLRPTATRLAFGTMLFALASYALAVTFTRGGYVGYCGIIAVLGVAAAIRWLRQRVRQIGRLAIAAVLVLVGLAVTIPIVSGPFMQSRLTAAQSESAARTKHWAQAKDMMDANATTALFGMGLGSFPRTFLVKDRGAASATFSYAREGDNGFVRLGSGKNLYLDQRVSATAGRIYTLSLDLRSADSKGGVHVPLCEKSLQYSFRCKQMGFQVKAAGKSWEHNEVTFSSEQIGSGTWLLRRPVVLSLANSLPGGVVDVDNVRLLDESGHDLIVNGDFSHGGARWFFSADDHLPWHIFNLWVQILFEQGWLGVLVIAVAVLTTLARLAHGMWTGEWLSATLLAALCGFLLIGVTESLFDGPRVTTLFFLLLFVGLLRPNWRGRASNGRTSPVSQRPVTGPDAQRGAYHVQRDIR